MAKFERKPLANTLKKDMKDRQNNKVDMADKVFEKLEGGGVSAPEKKKVEVQSKLTVMIPADSHEKLKRKALDHKKKIRELIIEFIDSL